jgi:hypothetical protein
VLTEFYASTTFHGPTFEEDLGVWLMNYSCRRIHGSLGLTWMQRQIELTEQISVWDDVPSSLASTRCYVLT